jgi:hypothetical protein
MLFGYLAYHEIPFNVAECPIFLVSIRGPQLGKGLGCMKVRICHAAA